MRLEARVVSIAIFSLPWIAHAAAEPEVKVREGLPAGLVIDGDLKEWTGDPSVTLGPANQVAGSVKLVSPADLSATVWVAISREGLAVAGRVTDDKVRFPQGDKVVNADHAEIWLAFPAASLPPLAYANQFGETEIPDADSCGTLEEIEDPDACRAWVREQRARRQSLERLFLRQYLLTPAGIQEAWATPAKDGVKAVPPQDGCCAASKAVVKEVPGGWVFEARIDAEDFPATKQVPLFDFAILVDIVDADDQIEKLESFVSTSPRRKLGRPSTFSAVTLREGLVWESRPPLLSHFAKGHDIFFFPGKTVSTAYEFVNEPVGYQYQPREPSPTVREMKVGGAPITKIEDVEVYWTGSPHGHALYSLRGTTVVDSIAAEGELVAHVKRAGTDTIQFLVKETATVSALGTGACGSCPLHSFRVISLYKNGSFKDVISEAIAEQMPQEDGSMIEDVKLEHEKEFVRIGFVGKKLAEDGETSRPWKQYWKWDPSRRTYVREN